MTRSLVRDIALVLSGLLFVASMALIALFISGNQIRCGLNPDIVMFYVGVAAVSGATLLFLVREFSPLGSHLWVKLAVVAALGFAVAWIWWLGPECSMVVAA